MNFFIIAASQISNLPKTIVQSGTANITGISNDWVTYTVTFNQKYSSTPLVTVTAPYLTGTATNWYMPMIKNISTTGFTFGWYAVSGTKTVLWEAIGVI